MRERLTKMLNFIIKDSQYTSTQSDDPPHEWIIEALNDVYSDVVKGEDSWICKGIYQFNFWLDNENQETIYCNAYELSNPDDFNDSSTENYCYYYELERV
jgi:hypothetical protein